MMYITLTMFSICYIFYVELCYVFFCCAVMCYIFYILLWCAMFPYCSVMCYVFYAVLWCAMLSYCAVMCYVSYGAVMCYVFYVVLCFVVLWPTSQGDHVCPHHEWGLGDSGLVRTLLGGKWYHLSKENRKNLKYLK